MSVASGVEDHPVAIVRRALAPAIATSAVAARDGAAGFSANQRLSHVASSLDQKCCAGID